VGLTVPVAAVGLAVPVPVVGLAVPAPVAGVGDLVDLALTFFPAFVATIGSLLVFGAF
jgi:hypothetical protein